VVPAAGGNGRRLGGCLLFSCCALVVTSHSGRVSLDAQVKQLKQVKQCGKADVGMVFIGLSTKAVQTDQCLHVGWSNWGAQGCTKIIPKSSSAACSCNFVSSSTESTLFWGLSVVPECISCSQKDEDVKAHRVHRLDYTLTLQVTVLDHTAPE